jgi:hypothetical protein
MYIAASVWQTGNDGITKDSPVTQIKFGRVAKESKQPQLSLSSGLSLGTGYNLDLISHFRMTFRLGRNIYGGLIAPRNSLVS